MKRPLRVGVIGVGNMGLHHARVYSQLPGVTLCGVADADESRARTVATRFHTRAYAEFAEMLDTAELDAVSVVVPSRAHLPVALAAISHNVSVLVEKPLAVNVADAETLVAAATRQGVILAVGHIERFNPAVQELKRQVQAGALGKLSSVIAKRVGLMPPQVRDADVIVDLAVHDIDILNYLFEKPPTRVYASGGNALLSERIDHAEIFLEYAGVGCFVQVNWITPLKIRSLSVTGDAGYAELNYMTQKLDIFKSNIAREYSDFGEFIVRFGEGERQAIPLPVQEPLVLELTDFLGAVAGSHPSSVPGETGVAVLQIIAQVQTALQKQNVAQP